MLRAGYRLVLDGAGFGSQLPGGDPREPRQVGGLSRHLGLPSGNNDLQGSPGSVRLWLGSGVSCTVG